jgi:hypothetical protein
MVIRARKLLTITVLIFIGVIGWQAASLYLSIQPAFQKLENEVPKNRDVYASEAHIHKLLFNASQTNQMKPTDFLARDALVFESEEGMVVHQLKRFILARKLTANFSQDDLLIHWLSTVYLGHGEYGLETTSQSLFGKDSRYLSQNETLAIAALIKSPNRYRNDIALWENHQNSLLRNLQNATANP